MQKLDSEIVVGGGVVDNSNYNVLITMKDLEQILSMSRSQIDRLSKTDSNFPQKIHFGESRQSMVRFHYDDVMTYILNKREDCINGYYQGEEEIRPS